MKKINKDTLIKLFLIFCASMILITGHCIVVDRIYRYHYDYRYSTIHLSDSKNIQLKE